MKALKTYVLLLALFCARAPAIAQSDSAVAIRQAILAAEKLDNAFIHDNWTEYISISYPGIVQYYGGAEAYRDHLRRARSMAGAAGIDRVEPVQLLRQGQEWQCVMRKTVSTSIDGRNAEVVSYLVGQSKDKGKTWVYFDVAYNTGENLVLIMPDMFDKLSIPSREIVFEKDDLAKKN